MKIEWETVENSQPDPEINRLLDQMCELSRLSYTFEMWVG